MWYRPGYMTLIASALAATLSAQCARATTIDFEDVLTPGLAAGFQITITVPDDPAAQISRGFNFRWEEFPSGSPPQFPQFDTHGHLSRAGTLDGLAYVWIPSNDPLSLDPVAESSTYVVTDDSFAPDAPVNALTISPVGPNPAPFSIQSFEVAEAFGPTKSARFITVTGFFDDGNDDADLFLMSIPLVGEDFGAADDVVVITEFQTVPFGPECCDRDGRESRFLPERSHRILCIRDE